MSPFVVVVVCVFLFVESALPAQILALFVLADGRSAAVLADVSVPPVLANSPPIANGAENTVRLVAA